jgi:ribosomal protein S9
MRKKSTIPYISIVIAVCMFILLFSGCSAVFKAGVSGTVRDADSLESPKEGISNMAVYAYTNKSARDTDLSQWQADNSKIGSSSSYVGRTTTAEDGTFTISRLVWETASPAFGKTADYRDIYFIFNHEDYGLHVNSTPVTIVSDSTNTNMVDETFSKVNQITDLQLNINDVAGGTLGQAVSVKITVSQGAGVDPKMYQTMINSAGTITVAHPKSLASAPYARIEVSLNGSTWIQCDKTGLPIDFATTAAPLSESPTLETVYMKNTEFEFPSLSGQSHFHYKPEVNNDDTVSYTEDDNMLVWFGYKDSNAKIIRFTDPSATATTVSSGDGSNGSIIRHGLFNGLGAGITWIDDTYITKWASLEVVVVFDVDKNGRLNADEGDDNSGDWYVPLVVYSNETTKSINIRTESNSEEVQAGDLP